MSGWVQVRASLAEYLKQEEAEGLVPVWLKALGGAALDYVESMRCDEYEY